MKINCPKCNSETNDLLTYCECGYQLNKLPDKSEYFVEDNEMKYGYSTNTEQSDINTHISNTSYCFRKIGKNLLFIIIVNVLVFLITYSKSYDTVQEIMLIRNILITTGFVNLIALGFITALFFDASKSILKIINKK